MSSSPLPTPTAASSDDVDLIDVDDDVVEEFRADEPAFLDADAADVEVVVTADDDDDAPMDVDVDDDDDDVALDDRGDDEEDLPPDESACAIDAHEDAVYAVAARFAGGGGALRVCSGGGDDRAWSTTVDVGSSLVARAPSRDLSETSSRPHEDSVSCAAFNTDAAGASAEKVLLGVGCYDGSLQVWEVRDDDAETLLHRLEGPTDVDWIAWHPKGGTVVLAGSTDGTVWMFHAVLGRCLQVFCGHEADVACGGFTADGRFALSAGLDGTLRVWAPRTGASRHVFRLGGDGAAVTCLAVDDGPSSSGLVLCGGVNGDAWLCHVGSKKVVRTLRHHDVADDAVAAANTDDDEDEEPYRPTSVEAVGFFPNKGGDGPVVQWCATGGVDGVLKVWDLANDGQCRQVCPHHDEGADAENAPGVTSLRWHPTRPLVFTASTDGVVRLWDARTGACVAKRTGGRPSIVNDMDVQYDDEHGSGVATITTGSDDGRVRIFRIDVNEATSK